MTAETKKIIFKGIQKKEQILFKSFLNLAKNDLSYDIEVVQDPDVPLDAADIMIVDAGYELTEEEKKMPAIPSIKVGDDPNLAGENYVLRPVQWSDFKEGLSHVSFDGVGGELLEEQRVLPTKFALEIGEEGDEDSELDDDEEISRSFSDASDYNFSLDKMSIDYHSFTNSDYEKVADDVKGFNEQESELPKAVVLVTDDESNNNNSVLVIETNSLERWDMSDSEFEEFRSQSVETPSQLEMPELGAKERKVVREKIAKGAAIELTADLWMTEQEVIAGAQTLFFIRPGERKVYSTMEPGKWIKILRNSELTGVDIASDWKPGADFKAYPIERLIWINTLVCNNERLDSDATDSQEFMLMSWPHFELLELDNSLLKLTTMLFVGPETAYSLMQKTGESRAVVYGMMNACKELELLVSPEAIAQKKFKAPSQDEGMFGKIKDVFR